jgi:hypothetical protein
MTNATARRVKPLEIVGHDEHRPRVGRRRQQAHDGGVTRQRLHLRPKGQPHRSAQRLSLDRRQLVHGAEHGPQQRRQGAEGQVGLRLHAGGRQEREVLGAGHRLRQQQRLAHARLAAHDQRSPAAAAGALQHVGQPRQLGVAAERRYRRCHAHRPRRHCE